MSLSKKHFEKVAKILNAELQLINQLQETNNISIREKKVCKSTVDSISNRLEYFFQKENNQFDSTRFRKAVYKNTK